MDHFLREQTTGRVLDTNNEFTISRTKARTQTLASAPREGLGTFYRLLDAALRGLGRTPANCITYRRSTRYSASYFRVEIPEVSPEQLEAFVEELRAPFGGDSNLRRLAQAVLIAATNDYKVDLSFPRKLLMLAEKPNSFALGPNSLEVPDNLDVSNSHSLCLEILHIGFSYPVYKEGLSRSLSESAHNVPERILPLESLSPSVSGFFEGRVHPFTAIRSYAYQTEETQASPCLSLDLWNGPYSQVDSSTAVLDEKPSTGFFFLRWRPNYGRPTMVHHGLESPLRFGPKQCRGSFMISPTDSPAEVLFFSQGIVSDPVRIEGPQGFTGLVCWPGLKFDLWGTQLVRDDNFDTAVAWAQEQAKATADCLAQYLEHVIDRVCNSQLLKANYYADEVASRMRALWGSPPST